jgi:hypothetical protein
MVLAVAVTAVLVFALLPAVVDLYQTELLIYGFTFAIAALGFNLLLGYTGPCRSATPPISASAPTRWRSSYATSGCTRWSCASSAVS